MKKLLLSSVAAISFVALANTAMAGAVAAGFNSSQLDRNDDSSTGAINPGFALNFFGTTYNSLFVNNNGNVTFNVPLSAYTPFNLTGATSVPIIAPFFADVDTRNPASGITSYGTGTYAGHQAFGVTWPGVGYFSNGADKLNTFQLILVNRGETGAGNFDIYFNYDQIQWDIGAVSNRYAAAGYSAGTGAPGSFFQLPGSFNQGALLDTGANALALNNDGGKYLFTVRSGVVSSGVPELSTWGMMLIGFAGLGFASYRSARKSAAA